MTILQDPAREQYILKISQKMIVRQNLPDEWLSCKIIAEKLLSYKVSNKREILFQLYLSFNFDKKYSQYSCPINWTNERKKIWKLFNDAWQKLPDMKGFLIHFFQYCPCVFIAHRVHCIIPRNNFLFSNRTAGNLFCLY